MWWASCRCALCKAALEPLEEVWLFGEHQCSAVLFHVLWFLSLCSRIPDRQHCVAFGMRHPVLRGYCANSIVTLWSSIIRVKHRCLKSTKVPWQAERKAGVGVNESNREPSFLCWFPSQVSFTWVSYLSENLWRLPINPASDWNLCVLIFVTDRQVKNLLKDRHFELSKPKPRLVISFLGQQGSSVKVRSLLIRSHCCFLSKIYTSAGCALFTPEELGSWPSS